MSLSRAAAKTFLKSLNDFDNVKELVSRAVDPIKPSLIKSLPKNRIKLEEAFSSMSFDWKEYKKDLNVPDSEFNAVKDDEPAYEYNDSWFKKLKEEYFELLEQSDDKLDELNGGRTADSESKQSWWWFCASRSWSNER